MDKIKVLLIEDNFLLREGIVAILKARKSITIKAVSGQKEDVNQILNRYEPFVILLSLGLYSQDSLKLVKELKSKGHDAKILIMDLAPTKKEIIQFMDAGATGFILKDAPTHEFINTIKAIAEDKTVNTRIYTDLLLPQIVEHALVKEEIDLKKSVQISKFEMKLLKLLNEGATNSDIAKELGITLEVVLTHIHNIKQNLSLFTLLELIHVISPESKPQDDN